MTVSTFTPNNSLITLTEQAIQHFESKLKQTNKKFIRLSTKESGCTGFAYVLDFADEFLEDDSLVEVNDFLTLAVDKEALKLIKNTEIDYVKEGLNGLLKFNNPNVTDACGCGESFAVGGSL